MPNPIGSQEPDEINEFMEQVQDVEFEEELSIGITVL